VATLISLRLRDGTADIRGHQTGLALASIVTRELLFAAFHSIELLTVGFPILVRENI
jgi:hypothetical protein